MAHAETGSVGENHVPCWRSDRSASSSEAAWEDSSSVIKAFSDALTVSYKRPVRK